MKRVLIVDDGPFMRRMLRSLFVKNGYEVVGEAEDGLIGVEKYRLFSPELVTLDINMPNMDGLEALKAIKKLDGSSTVVMVSSIGQETIMREAIRSGADGFLVKPFDEKTFLEVIENV